MQRHILAWHVPTLVSCPTAPTVERVSLHAADGLEARIITYGASLQALMVPDEDGRRDDIVLGHDDVRGISRQPAVLWRDRRALCQPHRRTRASCSTATRCNLRRITAPMRLHGGLEGFDRRNWQIVEIEDGDRAGRDACLYQRRWRGGLSRHDWMCASPSA